MLLITPVPVLLLVAILYGGEESLSMGSITANSTGTAGNNQEHYKWNCHRRY